MDAFSRAVKRYGGAPAIVSGDEVVTYEALDLRSNQLAHALRAEGVQAGDSVALLLDRSTDAIVVILATLKAGAVYMPVDPTYPASYLEAVLSQAAPRLIISRDALAVGSASRTLTLEALDRLGSTLSTNAPTPTVEANSAAYIMHTSGSSGTPKGVVAPHRAVVRLVRDQTYLRFTPDEVFLHASPLAFDASTLEIWGPLLNGGCVAVLPDARPSLDTIAAAIARHRVTTAWFTAGLFHLLIDHKPEALDPLRQILAGGDVLSPSHVAKAIARLPGRSIINGYGPTENTTFTCCRRITAADAAAGAIPIGHPIAHTEVFIVDEAMSPVADGAQGQLVAAGDGLALGYVNRPDLTAERFVNLALGGDAPRRVYLTGDLARRREDGVVEFLGRVDAQVKIDGKRIELGEIEHQLRKDFRVQDAAVIAKSVGNSKHLLGYVVPSAARASLSATTEILAELRTKLPTHMCPASIVLLSSFPLTPNGKLDRIALARLTADAAQPQPRTRTGDLRSILSEIWTSVLGATTVDPSVNFFDLGGTSLQLVEVHARAQARLGRTISIVDLFQHPTLSSFASHLQGDEAPAVSARPSGQSTRSSERDASEPIAIIGVAGRFPGATGIDQFWRNVRAGVDSITRFDDSELEDAFDDETRASAEFVRARPVLPDVDMMDAAFFGIYPREAAVMDPQHRVFLECAWEAFEDAGYAPGPKLGPVGVFAGCSMNTYFLHHLCADRGAIETFTSGYQVGDYTTLVGSLSDTLATRVSYKLDLRGPSATVQSACSTSLLAVAQACQSLRSGQSAMALAGGVSITFPQKRGYLHQPGGIVSADGKCRPFDAEASGTVFGSGAGAVLLKRLSDALRDGDQIYATIRGCGVNNDGAQKVGFTAPSSDGQAAAIGAALDEAGIDAASIGYVECHGTATPLGDPIELAGLAQAFSGAAARARACALGSVKANVGHLDAAAGVAGLIKAALALKHATIPPLTNFAKANERLELDPSSFYFPTEASPWDSSDAPRRAGVSSFGVGGTNVHVVLEEAASAQRQPDTVARMHVLPLSARSEAALKSIAANVANAIAAAPDPSLDSIAFTLQSGRAAFSVRDAIACASPEDAVAKLRSIATRTGEHARANRLVFMFPGQGAQYAGMGGGLYRDDRAFRDDIDHGAETLAPMLDLDIRDLVRAASGDESRLHLTQYTQPALFVLEYALGRYWMRRGLRPDAMVGHSMGEIVAACLAGVFSFSDGCRLVARRAMLMQALPGGAMVAVRMSEADARAAMGPDLDLAAVNAPSLCVVAGPFSAIEQLEERLAEKDIPHRRLLTSHAFHSRAMDPVVEALEDVSRSITFFPPTFPIASCVTGKWATPEELASPSYWSSHCRKAVRFHDALATAVGEATPFLLEVGPNSTLSAIAAQAINRRTLAGIANTLPGPDTSVTDSAQIATATAKLWRAGVNIEFEPLNAGGARRVSLPTYPFERRRHWVDAPPVKRGASLQEPQPGAPSGEPFAALPQAIQIFSAQPPSTDQPSSTELSSQRLETPMPSPTVDDRGAALRVQIAEIVESLSGEKVDPKDYGAGFLDLGFDSLFLGQVARALERNFKIKLTFRQLLNDFPSLDRVAEHIAATTTAAPKPAAAAPAAIAAPGSAAGPQGAHLAALQAQIEAISKQLSMLQGGAAQPPPAPAAATPAAPAAPGAQPPAAPETGGRFRPYQPTSGSIEMTSAQKAFVADLVDRTTRRTPTAKSQTQQNRSVLADPRTAAGYRPEWKELVYPVVAQRSHGAKIWDLDGNVYIDLVNGYGQTMFGHAPSFVTDAVAEQIKQGFAIGPQSPLAGEVARMLADMVGMERITFCNTGSEAVMAAMRLARAITGRSQVVVFANDYHGQFDEVLVKPGRAGAPPRALPIAPGIPPETMANMIVLQYGAQESLDWISANADDVAAVIIEPVQSRHPELRPLEFVKTLREITARNEVALVFDEIVTGFRTHPGGMQAIYGVRADMATYGKVVGGGMPIGVLAGASRFMDALDGGSWRFGDDSAPEVAPTFFAGTFVRHPLVLAACKAVLARLAVEGPALQEKLAARTAALVARINADLERRGLISRVEGYSSWFMVSFSAEDRFASLLYPQMRSLGVHIQEAYPCFLTTEHSDADIDAIARVFAESLDALAAAGILAGKSVTPKKAAERFDAPLTEPQLEILLAAQMGDDASCAFNESVSIKLEGDIDQEALSAALNDVVARHDALRSTIIRGEARMSIAPALSLSLPFVDLSRAPQPAAAFAALLDADARSAFDLFNGPLFRAQIVRTGARAHTLVLTGHHIVCDGWSINVILEDLAACYRARRSGQPAGLPDALQFSSYSLSQAASRPEQKRSEAFWSEQYSSIPDYPDLPADRARAAQRSFAGATASAQFPASLVTAVRKAGASKGGTLFATLFGAFQVLIGRLSGSNDVAVGVPSAGQAFVDQPSLVGHCVNFLPFRAPFDWNEPFAAHLKRVTQHVLDASDYQDCTLGTLVRKLGVPRTPDRLPITEVQFNLERLGDNLDFNGQPTTVSPNPKAFANYTLFFNLVESAQGLRIDCDYRQDLLDAETVGRWIGHYRQILEDIARNVDAPIGTIELLSPREKDWLVKDCNRTDAPLDRCPRVQDLFRRQARATPDAIACTDADGDLSYKALDEMSDALARGILAATPVRQGRVAIAAERSRDILIAILGILKAGHAYVPLDITQPPWRTVQIAQEASVSAVVAAHAVGAVARTVAEAAKDAPVLDIRGQHPKSGALPDATELDCPAYVLFTSGSTGVPKGVEITQRALVNLLTAVAREPGCGAQDTLVASTSFTFDIAMTELLMPLITGARIVMATTDEIKGGFGLVAKAVSAQATILQATPSLWRMLVEARFESWPGLKMITVGEMMPRDLADSLMAGGGRLWNLYGPTETTIYSSGVELKRGGGPVTIGVPLANQQLHVLDGFDQPCPIGVAGNLYIGGAGLATGYLGRPDITAAAFRTIPVGGRVQRLYRTGDIARRLSSGELSLLGRSDHQVKLRGFRIELEEIEIVLRSAPGVASAAAAVRSDVAPDPKIVGYYVPAAGAEVSPGSLAGFLAKRLPDYMIPTVWAPLSEMPLTANGKLDRKALPRPAVATVAVQAPSAKPGTAMEEKIAAVWATVLGLPATPLDEPIFALGADSLQIFRISARLAESGLDIDARQLMRNPSVRDLAASVEEAPVLETVSGSAAPTLGQFRRGAMRKKETSL